MDVPGLMKKFFAAERVAVFATDFVASTCRRAEAMRGHGNLWEALALARC